MLPLKKIAFSLLTVAIGLLFVYSGITKADPIQPLEYTIVEYLHLPWTLAAILARSLVGLEISIGALIALHIFGKGNWVLKFAMLLLLAFSGYLVYLWAVAGNDVNCGCFGDAIWMSPSASLVKNAATLVAVWIVNRHCAGLRSKILTAVAWFIPVVGMATMMIVHPISMGKPKWLRTDKYEIDFQELGLAGGATPLMRYGALDGHLIADSAIIDLYKGKHVIAFLSQTCPHCRIAASKMHLMKERNPALPFVMIIGGQAELSEFWKITRATNIPYVRLDKDPFLNYTGGIFPLIIFVDNGWVVAKADYNTMTQTTVEQWLEQKE